MACRAPSSRAERPPPSPQGPSTEHTAPSGRSAQPAGKQAGRLRSSDRNASPMTQPWEQSRGQGQGRAGRTLAAFASQRSPAAAHPGHHGAEAWRGEPGRGHGSGAPTPPFPLIPGSAAYNLPCLSLAPGPPSPQPGSSISGGGGGRCLVYQSCSDLGPPGRLSGSAETTGRTGSGKGWMQALCRGLQGEWTRGACLAGVPCAWLTPSCLAPSLTACQSLSLHGDEERPPMSPAQPAGLGGGCAYHLPLVHFPISGEGLRTHQQGFQGIFTEGDRVTACHHLYRPNSAIPASPGVTEGARI